MNCSYLVGTGNETGPFWKQRKVTDDYLEAGYLHAVDLWKFRSGRQRNQLDFTWRLRFCLLILCRRSGAAERGNEPGHKGPYRVWPVFWLNARDRWTIYQWKANDPRNPQKKFQPKIPMPVAATAFQSCIVHRPMSWKRRSFRKNARYKKYSFSREEFEKNLLWRFETFFAYVIQYFLIFMTFMGP